MGYVFLIIAVLTSTLKAYSSKRISADVITVSDNIHVTQVRMLLCVAIGVLGVITAADGTAFSLDITELLICALSGLSLISFVMSWLFAVKTGAFLLVNAFTSASFIVPGIVGVFLLKERFTVYKIMAVVCICAALFFLVRYNTRIKGRIGRRQVIFLVLAMLSQGINQAMQKLYVYYAPERDGVVYNFYSFVSGTFFLAVFSLIWRRKGEMRSKMSRRVYVYIAVMAIALFLNTYFMTLAATSIEAIILYPLSSALSLVAGSITAHVCFGEKIKRDSAVGIVFTLAALLLSQM